MFCFLIHVHRNILSAQCQICVEQNNSDSLHVEMNSTCLGISLLQNGVPQNKFDIVAPIEFFIPTSVSGISQGTSMEIDKDSVTFVNSTPTINLDGKKVFVTNFRFQIPNIEVLRCTESEVDSCDTEISILNQRFSDLLKNPQDISKEQISKSLFDVKDFLKQAIKPKTSLQLHCTSCHIPVGEAIFSEIKDYCSESSSEGWFCHPTDSLQISDKLPNDSLYIDETSFLFQDVYIGQNPCKCGSTLSIQGSQPKGFVRVYFDKIIFRTPTLPPSVNGSEYKRWVSLLMLWSLIERSRTPSLFSKIFLQSKASNCDTDTCLFLMIPNEKVSRFRLQGSLSEIPAQTNLKTEAVLKILFLVGNSASKDFKSWKHNFEVDFYPVSDTMMDIVTELLLDSVEKDHQSRDGFSCGYLPACPYKT